MTGEATPRQRELYDYMLAFHGREGYWPTVREMSRQMGTVVNAIYQHLTLMEKKGLAFNERPGQSRGWAAVAVEDVYCCPHCGGDFTLGGVDAS